MTYLADKLLKDENIGLPEDEGYIPKGIRVNVFKEKTGAMIEKKIVGIAYEDVNDKDGEFPLLKPMSVIAGKGGFRSSKLYAKN